jgi:hypothetical protein
VLLLLLPFSINAATLDFSAYSAGYQGTTQITLPEAVVTSFGTDLYVYPDFSRVCAISGGSCEADLEIDFVQTVSDLSFIVHGYGVGDSVLATLYDELDNVITSVTITTQTFIDFSGYTGISRIYFDDSSTSAGLAFGEITFQPVPIPAAVWLFGSGLLGLAGMSRRKKAMT